MWLAAAAMLAAGAVAPASPLAGWAGRYDRHFADRLVDGTRYTGQNIVEIVPVDANAAYVRVHLDVDNGHQCAVAGVARMKSGALVYRAATSPADSHRCVLTVTRANGSLHLDDGADRSCSDYCGARGSFADVRLSLASHRDIRYLPRLRASGEYARALAEWRTGTPQF